MELVKGNPAPFAICYTIGNVVSICGTCFLYGPFKQAKKMFALTRLVNEQMLGNIALNVVQPWTDSHWFFTGRHGCLLDHALSDSVLCILRRRGRTSTHSDRLYFHPIPCTQYVKPSSAISLTRRSFDANLFGCARLNVWLYSLVHIVVHPVRAKYGQELLP